MPTFKEVEKEYKVIKKIKKAGLSLCLVFNKEDIKRFNLSHNKEIDLSNAEILETELNN